MPNNVRHFAIHADDVERARTFYTSVFDWVFEAYGPPGFYRIQTGTPDDPGIFGALQQRTEPLAEGGVRGFECTVSVDDLEDARRKVQAAGGTITFPGHEIPGVGTLFQFEDTEGNRLCAMQYEPERLADLFPR